LLARNQLVLGVSGPVDDYKYCTSVSLFSLGITFSIGFSVLDYYNGVSKVLVYKILNAACNRVGSDIYEEVSYDFFDVPMSLSSDGNTAIVNIVNYFLK
jgi:hypothetical protein